MFVSDYVVDEIREVTARRFPDRADVMDHFLASLLDFVGQVVTPEVPEADEDVVRDDADRPVLRGARAAGCDFLITGDKDLLEAGIENPAIVAPADYLRRFP